jgi:RNA polymerase sigma factor (sigma-70 family)
MYNRENKMPFDDSPLALLYDHYAHIILNTVSRYTQSQEDARDLVLEVFTAALENQIWNTWSEKEQLAWLCRIARNKGVDHYRRITRHPAISLENISHLFYEDEQTMPENIVMLHEEHAQLRENLSNLSELQQEIVRLRFGHDLRSKEIALRLNKSDDLVRVLLSRALNHLRKMYIQQKGK